MEDLFDRLVGEEEGQGLIEYSLPAALDGTVALYLERARRREICRVPDRSG